MRAMVLMYHDVVERGAWEASGFPGVPAARYKLDRRRFAEHLQAIAQQITEQPALIADLIDAPIDRPFLLTFDDGGESAYSHVAGMLEEFGWRGHFFVTTNYIDHPAFLTRAQIRDLHRRGHLIGSHSASHPSRLAHCYQSELERQWRTSVDALSDVIGAPVDIASVPGGQYSRSVGAAAASAGIRVLFTSEPTTAIRESDGLRVIGRFAVTRRTPARAAAMIARGGFAVRAREQLLWQAKEAVKTVSGGHYVTLRTAALLWLARFDEPTAPENADDR